MQLPCIPILTDIAASLKTIAAWAQHQHIQATGEKEHEIGGYVRSHNAGGPILYLYATHPGLKFRVATIYEERWHELPFIPAANPKYSGEQPPSKDYAERNNILIKVNPFRITMLPTGKETDAGHKEYKLSRVLAAPQPQAARKTTPAPAPPQQRPQAQPRNTSTPNTPYPSTTPPDPNQDIAAASAKNMMKQLDCTGLDLSARPLAPDALICALRKKAAKLGPNATPLLAGGKDPETGERIPNQKGAVIGFLNQYTGGNQGRHKFTAQTFGFGSFDQLSGAQQRALHGWIKFSPHHGPSTHAIAEAKAWAAANAIPAPHQDDPF